MKNVLSFSTEAEDIPLIGHNTALSLMFDHTDNLFITASMCAVQLVLTTIHSNDQVVFCEKVVCTLTPRRF